jgi:hypothetical protein
LNVVAASVNTSSAPVTLSMQGGVSVLTIPVNIDYSIPLPRFSVTLFANFTGQIVGQRGTLGDYNGDNTVGPEDFFVWQSTYCSTTDLAADGNLDGIVGTEDYVVWRNQLDQTIPGGGAASLVPEPETIVLFGSACAMLILRKIF